MSEEEYKSFMLPLLSGSELGKRPSIQQSNVWQQSSTGAENGKGRAGNAC
jgi:hypothetical protein